MRSIKVYTPPAIEPVTVAEVKAMARVDISDDDTLINDWIKVGRELAENFQGRSYINQTIDSIYDSLPCMPIVIPRPPLVSITSITITDINGLDASIATTDFDIDTNNEPGRICFKWGKTWPFMNVREINCLKIRYLAGYGATEALVPQCVKDAIALYVIYRYENRAAEITTVPDHFYNLLRQDRIFTK